MLYLRPFAMPRRQLTGGLHSDLIAVAECNLIFASVKMKTPTSQSGDIAVLESISLWLDDFVAVILLY